MKRKTIRKARLYFETASGYLLALICFFGAYLVYPDSFFNLKDVMKAGGRITNTRVLNKKTSIAGKYKLNADVFVFNIANLDKNFEIYNPTQNYTTYKTELSVEDSVNIYFRDVPTNDKDVAVLQIEKNKKVVLNQDSYKIRNRFAFVLCILGGSIFIVISTLKLKKDLKPKPLA